MRGAWKYHDKCIKCGTTKLPHKGHGLCRRCHARQRYSENRERINILARASRDRVQFGGHRQLVLDRSNGKCVKCGNPATDIHHIDHDGPSSVSWIDKWAGNIGKDPDRMEALCKSCHARVHKFHAKKRGL